MGFAACKKQSLTPLNESSQETSVNKIKVKDGALVFENEAHMYEEMTRISELTNERRLQFENKLGFRSLLTIDNEITKAEVDHQENFYKSVSPNLSVEEYEKLGLFYKHTDLFQEYLDKKIIVKIVEKDRSWGYKMAIDNPGFLHLLNKKGLFFVGDKKYQFNGTWLGIYDSNQNMISETNFQSGNSKIQSGWSQASVWNYNGSNQRFDYKVYGACITSSNQTPGGIIQSTFYVNATGEERKFGSWAKRGSYLPVYSFSGSWTATYSAQTCFTCPVQNNPIALSDNDPSSPFSWASYNDPYGSTNNFLRYLKPNGSWTLPTPWLVVTAFKVNYSMNFNFSGGSSGYSRNLSL